MGRLILMLVFGTIGTGVGLGIGYLGGAVAGGLPSAAQGVCTTVDTAANQGLVTPAQAEKIGAEIFKKAQKDNKVDVTRTWLRKTPNEGEACEQLRKGFR